MKKTQPRSRRARWWMTALPCFSSLVVGCHTTSKDYCCNNSPNCIDNCATIPEGAIPVEAGTYLKDYINRHTFKAEQDDFVIYKHEWFKGGTELGPYGSYHVHEIIKRLPDVPFPVILQISGNQELDTVRRGLVVSKLLNAGYVDADQRVILAFPEAEGLYGEEAERIYGQMLYSNPYGNSGYGGFGRGGFGNRFFGGGGGFFGGRRGIDDRRPF